MFRFAKIEIVRSFLQSRESSERYDNTVLRQFGGFHRFLWRDEVQGTTLVVRTPLSPVRKLRLPFVDLLDGHLRRGLEAFERGRVDATSLGGNDREQHQ